MIKALLMLLSRSILMLGISCVFLSARANNQDYERWSVYELNVPLKTILRDIQKQTGLQFTYSNDEVNHDVITSVVASNTTLDSILYKTFDKIGYSWKRRGNFIIVNKKNQSEKLNILLSTDTTIEISGMIVDEKGSSIPGVTVYIKGTKKGVVTNGKGEYTLKDVIQGSTLVISSLGFVPQEIFVDAKWKRKTVVLKESINKLDETVVAGYYTTSRRYNTGDITTIGVKSIEGKAITNPLLALQGEVPGVIVNQSSGVANSGISVLIRGQNSFVNGTDPLYVVDGVPYPSQLPFLITTTMGNSGFETNPTARAGNSLSFLNPNDIESISVLRDADATSIYGSRAAAGAIIITTKKGKSGPMKLSLNFQKGIGKVSRRLNLLNNKQYLQMRHEAKMNDGLGILPTDYDLNGTWDTTRNTDWQKVLLGGSAKYSDVQASMSGGSELFQYLLGLGYHDETTVYPTDLGDKKGSVHLNIANTSADKKFQIQFSGTYMLDENRLPPSNLGPRALSLPPVAPPLYKSDGTLDWGTNKDSVSTWLNPLAAFQGQARNKTTNLVSNLRIQYELFPGLSFKTNFGYTSIGIDEYQTTPLTTRFPERRKTANRIAAYSNGNSNTWIIEPQLNYKVELGNGLFDVLIGSTLQQKNDNQIMLSGSGYSTDLLLKDPRSASILISYNTVNNIYRYNALFGIINYRLKDRYIINLSARRDGSSRFGNENLFHNFGSVGTAWIFTSEPWIHNNISFLSFGKLRASYGNSGNDQIGDYKFINNYSSNKVPISYQGVVGLTPVGIPNPYLQWEETKKFQLGVDLGFLKDNLILTAVYYRNRSSNQLLSYLLPTIAGAYSYPRNLPATIQNSGLEVTLNYSIIKRDVLNWNTSLNFSINRNKLVSFPDLENSVYSYSYVVGKPMSGIRLYDYRGVNSTTGLYEFVDSKGELTSSPIYTDASKMKDLTPDFYGGVNNEIRFKNFQINILMQVSKRVMSNGYPGLASGPGYFSGTGDIGNQLSYVLDRWTYTNDRAAIQKYSTVYSPSFNAALTSTLSYSDTWMVRLKNISCSWEMPDSWINKLQIKSCKLSLNCTNLLTFTNFKGLDPESGTYGLPPLRIITGGINVVF